MEKTMNASEMMEAMTRLEPPLPELLPYIQQSSRGFGTILHHPFIIELFFDPNRCGLINMRFKAKIEAAVEAREKKNWPSFVFLHERPYRVPALLTAMQLGCDDAGLVGNVWTDSENIWQHKKTWIKIWSDLSDPRATMDDNERVCFDVMPETVTIHRGISHPKHNRIGLSWTRDKERAVWFAHRFARSSDKPMVIDATVQKKNVLAYFNGRSEEEVVVLPKHVRVWGKP
jgi:hypothetical protein